ncbi:WUSCHEL-related homeobox 7-like [Vigna radiata var. radiata]|uniref:WUSCHEL-related homeobox 7-like n=1 Tax=Vigna radiata var. radiata TaxID=3916 RepID=A0A1S3T9U0_VIGRR|nr:WUSCHEL-related homeobox 7-like [Vigna radiata var. radiata]
MSKGMENVDTTYKRWQSTPQQIQILLNIYNHGIINTNRDQIREIAERLRVYGEVGEYSVYCWFQNHGNRIKHRRLPQDVSGTSGHSYSLLPAYIYDPSWVIPQFSQVPPTPQLLDLFPIPPIREEEAIVIYLAPFRLKAPSTVLSLRPPSP